LLQSNIFSYLCAFTEFPYKVRKTICLTYLRYSSESSLDEDKVSRLVGQSSSKYDYLPVFDIIEDQLSFERGVLIIDKPLIRARFVFSSGNPITLYQLYRFHQLYSARSARYSGINKAILAETNVAKQRPDSRTKFPRECRPLFRSRFREPGKNQREQRPALLSQTHLVCRRFANLLTGASVQPCRSSR